MAFNLKLVLKALLFSSSQPLSTKEIQTILARFHEQAARRLAAETEEETTAPVASAESETAAEAPP
ncbi:MAG: SMC-Scp complex subunit ScpB, partial [Opitutaceae bacterium]|nr:SMC-Scp complex subunit ScpB [Opitutaceae bacterium]